MSRDVSHFEMIFERFRVPLSHSKMEGSATMMIILGIKIDSIKGKASCWFPK